MTEGAFIIGPNGQVTKIQGKIGKTPECPQARYRPTEVVRVRRLKFLRHLPAIGAIVVVVPPRFSPDWAWADYLGKPRPLMCQVGREIIQYIVAFEGDRTPHLLREAYLLPSAEPAATITVARGERGESDA